MSKRESMKSGLDSKVIMPPTWSELKVRHEGWIDASVCMGKKVPSLVSSFFSLGKMKKKARAAAVTMKALAAGIVFSSDPRLKARRRSTARKGVVSTAAMKRKRMWTSAAYQAKKTKANS